MVVNPEDDKEIYRAMFWVGIVIVTVISMLFLIFNHHYSLEVQVETSSE